MLRVRVQVVKRGDADAHTDHHLGDLSDGDDGGRDPGGPSFDGGLKGEEWRRWWKRKATEDEAGGGTIEGGDT